MELSESLTFAEYWEDKRFRLKRPRMAGDRVDQNGDNCYQPIAKGAFRQLPSQHWKQPESRVVKQDGTRDLRGRRVLVAERFAYYGEAAQTIPAFAL